MLSYLRKITLHFHHLHFSPLPFPFIFYYIAQKFSICTFFLNSLS
ncbi:hypothetical protein DB41_IB00660 [Neochlamydia sp. TUME1]|nr:hypothetical protein DB41_IB00660 [Neochlamydia sp. TUME1]